MEKPFCKAMLLQSSIFELRNIAREIGVKSPTSLKKEDLITQISNIVDGNQSPYVAKSKQGRPPKFISSGKLLESIIPNGKSSADDNCFENSINLSGEFCLSEKLIAFLEDDKNQTINVQRIQGYLDILNDGYGLIRQAKGLFKVGNTIYLSESQIKNYNLKAGDLLDVEARVLQNDKPSVLIKVLRINGREYKSGARNVDFETLPVEFPVAELKLEGENINQFPKELNAIMPIIKGTKIMIKNKKGNSFKSNALITSLTKLKGTKFVVLQLETTIEGMAFYNNLTECEVIYCMLNEPCSHQIATLKLAMERVKRLTEEKNDVLLLVIGLERIVKNQNYLDNNSLNDIKKHTLLGVKEMLCQARSTPNGSLTILSTFNYKNDNGFDQIVIDEIEEFVTKVFENA